jgi:hypothetical protein
LMTPAKKKKKAAAPKPCPPAAPPAPVLTAPQRRSWMVITKRNAMGAIFFTSGVGVLAGHWFYHREWHTPSFVGSMLAMLFGALMVEPAAVKDAGGTLVGWAKDLLPFAKKSDPPPPSV